jgi:hypothetical protein
MIAKLAKTYIMLLLILGTLTLTLTIFLHIRALLGIGFPINHLFITDFAIAIPLVGLAKERNIWANEIKALPKWVKPLTIGLLFYSIAIALAIIWTPSRLSPAESPVVFRHSSALSFPWVSVSQSPSSHPDMSIPLASRNELEHPLSA